jgi:hypothetical protein
MPWRGPLGGAPLETLPGPDNPWLACRGESDALLKPVPGHRDPDLPDLALSDDGATGVDWTKIGVGTSMMSAGTIVIVAAVVGGLAAAASLPATTTGVAPGNAVAVTAATLAAGGVILTGAGTATVVAAIDPKVSDYKKHVAAVPTRKLALPGDLPPAAMTFMQSVAEIERLSTAETDIIDHARAAAKANDKSWTELHLRDLYHVQNAKQHLVGRLAPALKDINAGLGKDFDGHRVNPDEALRDLINPIIEMRSTLNEVAGLSSAEINNILSIVRVPSPVSKALNASIQRFAKQAGGQPSQMVDIAVDQLERLDVIDHAAFGLKR